MTFTLSAKQGIHSDYEIKRLLFNSMMISLKRHYGIKHYVWRAEPQKNGRIHFHVVSNQFIHYQELRDEWNNCQKKLGYIDLFNESNHHIDPNSTDIKAVINPKKITGYLAKYLAKSDPSRRKIKGRLWGCSDNLLIQNDNWIELNSDNSELFQNLYTRNEDKVFNHDFFTFIPMTSAQMKKQIPKPWYHDYALFLDNVKVS